MLSGVSEIFETMDETIGTFTSNITDMSRLFSALTNTFLACKNFILGGGEFKLQLAGARDFNQTQDYFEAAQFHAHAGHNDLGNTSFIDASVRNTWDGYLYDPPSGGDNIYSWSTTMLTHVLTAFSDPLWNDEGQIDALMLLMEGINFTSIFEGD